MLADGLYALLANAAAVAAILGAPAARADKTTGVFKVQMPEGANVPAVVFMQVAGDTLFSMEGPDALRFVRYQFTCYGATPMDAAKLQRAIRQVLETFTGTLADGSEVDSMECILEMELFEDAPFLFTAVADMKIAFRDLSN